ncbi:MAG: ABC-2 type transport system permease protein, partial [Candidatus Latescibacterota bacterium]
FFSDYTEFGIIFSDLEYLVAYFVKLVGFFSFCLFLGVLVKRSAFAIGFLFVWFVIESIIYGVLKWKIFRDSDLSTTITQFFPLESMSNLIKEPVTRLGGVQSVANQLGEEFTKNYDVQFLSIAIVLVWTFLFIYWSYAILKKRDL